MCQQLAPAPCMLLCTSCHYKALLWTSNHLDTKLYFTSALAPDCYIRIFIVPWVQRCRFISHAAVTTQPMDLRNDDVSYAVWLDNRAYRYGCSNISLPRTMDAGKWCDQHADRKATSYCRNCNQLMCETYIITYHNGHSHVTVNEVVREFSELLSYIYSVTLGTSGKLVLLTLI